ncbi:hypothetical protein BURKHO8Y_190045 [Burkholderia sp. 8Y]|nr:hypothetical protein BURKHO8Y_190045 [Burkholderia sp. 8Y]
MPAMRRGVAHTRAARGARIRLARPFFVSNVCTWGAVWAAHFGTNVSDERMKSLITQRGNVSSGTTGAFAARRHLTIRA